MRNGLSSNQESQNVNELRVRRFQGAISDLEEVLEADNAAETPADS